MTRKEIQGLKGRELDVVVAREIFGWHYGNYHTDLAKYSSDLPAAWEVVEKMMGRYIYINIDTYHQKYIVEAVRQTSHIGDYKILSEVESESAPEAICKAALLAVLGEEEA